MRILYILFIYIFGFAYGASFPIQDDFKIKKFEDYLVALRSAKGNSKLVLDAVKNSQLLAIKGYPEPFYITNMLLGKGGFKEVYLGIKGGNVYSFMAIAVMPKNNDSLDIANSSIKLIRMFPTVPPGIEPFLMVDTTSVPNKIYVGTPLYVGDFNKLKEYLAENTAYIPSAADCFRQVINGVKFIHSKKLFHGDIKPANFLYSPAGTSGKLNCDLADLDSLLSDQGYYTPAYYPFFIEQNRGPVDKSLRDRFSVSLSFLEVIGWISGDSLLNKKIDDYQNMSVNLGEVAETDSESKTKISKRSGKKLNSQDRVQVSKKMKILALEIGKDLVTLTNDCRRSMSRNKYCSIFQNDILDFIFNNFVNLHK